LPDTLAIVSKVAKKKPTHFWAGFGIHYRLQRWKVEFLAEIVRGSFIFADFFSFSMLGFITVF
jgi:hypothetical protein